MFFIALQMFFIGIFNYSCHPRLVSFRSTSFCHSRKTLSAHSFILLIISQKPGSLHSIKVTLSNSHCSFKQAGTGPSRRHIQGSKIAKRLPSVKYSFTVVENQKFFENFFLKKLHTKKMDRVARRGSLPRAPGPLTSHNAEKLKGGPFEVFQHPFCRKTWKNWRKQKFSFSGKNLTMPKKNWKGGPFGIFQHPFCRKTSKKCRGTLWGKKFRRKKFRKKMSRSAEKNERVFGLARYGMLRGKTGKTFLVQFARPNSAFWCNNIL